MSRESKEYEEKVANYPDALNPITIPLEDTDALKEALGIPKTNWWRKIIKFFG